LHYLGIKTSENYNR